MTGLTGAGWFFCAAHRDPVRKELHGHSYEVMAWWPLREGHDACFLQDLLKQALVGIDHTTLPDEFTRAEDIARLIGSKLPGAIRIDISRPIERIACEVWL